MSELAVFLAGRRIGTLRGGARPSLTYLDGYDATPLSLSMPTSVQLHTGRSVMHWLDGVLPDSDLVRERWGREFGVSARNPVALVSRVGADLPGAVQIVEDRDGSGLLAGRRVGVDESAIGQRLAELRRDGSSWTRVGERWSLAGAQPKFALARHGGEWFSAVGGEATTHIVKPGLVGLRSQSVVEHITMRAAARLGLRVARTEFCEFAGEPAIVVERYDRLVVDGVVVRLHQEDLAQAMSVPTARKYESGGGPSAAQIADVLRSRAGGDAAWRFVEAVAFNYLVGAPDAHTKNYSVLLSGEQVRLAPLYDLASSLPYDERAGSDLRTTAMAIAGERHFGKVTDQHWVRFARRAGVDPDRLLVRVGEISAGLPDAVADVAAALPADREVVQLVNRFQRGLAAHVPPAPVTRRTAGVTGDGGPVSVQGYVRAGRRVSSHSRSRPQGGPTRPQ